LSARARKAERFRARLFMRRSRSIGGLLEATHADSSIIDFQTLTRFENPPISFLRGCGLPENLIEYLPPLRDKAIQFNSCFTSYSTKDQLFADRLRADLQNKGVRCWFAPHDLPIGAKTWDAIDEAIRRLSTVEEAGGISEEPLPALTRPEGERSQIVSQATFHRAKTEVAPGTGTIIPVVTGASHTRLPVASRGLKAQSVGTCYDADEHFRS
jgi:hypothetical protein